MKNRTVLIYSMIGVFLFLSMQSTLSSQSEEASRILETYQQSVITFVSIDKEKNQIARGTGFLIGPEMMLTNYNLISLADKVEGWDFRGKKVKIEGILGMDKNYNVAILKAKSKLPALAVGNVMEAGIGNKVFAVGGDETGGGPMTVFFLSNIGSSDLQLANGERPTPPREAGERLLALWDDPAEAVAERLVLPGDCALLSWPAAWN